MANHDNKNDEVQRTDALGSDSDNEKNNYVDESLEDVNLNSNLSAKSVITRRSD